MGKDRIERTPGAAFLCKLHSSPERSATMGVNSAGIDRPSRLPDQNGRLSPTRACITSSGGNSRESRHSKFGR